MKISAIHEIHEGVLATTAVGSTDMPVVDTSLAQGIPKPSDAFNLDDFRSNVDTSGVGAILRPLPHFKIADANDFVRLHPNENTHWSSELCFVTVPIVGQRGEGLHLIKKEVAVRNQVPEGRLKYFRLALASKPQNQFFLCHVPSRNLDNTFNADAIEACRRAKTQWISAISKSKEGSEGYHIVPARHDDAFPEPLWLPESLIELIKITFDDNHRITDDNHPALARILGLRQSLE
jgi:hypothetical protein